jgi:hypothetical protein
MRKLLRKIFRAKQNQGQFFFAGLGFLIGLLLLLVSVQLYIQINRLLDDRNKYPEYLIISKKINFGNTLFLSKPGFTSQEMEDLKEQTFTEDIGAFVSNQFEVIAFSNQLRFYSELFFEGIDNRFIDDVPANFKWEENEEEIPVILSHDMLDLYNFGYAMGKGGGMPQLSASTAKLVSISIKVRGMKGEKTFKGKIVGFTQRIPSILVPKNFVEWANANLGFGETKNPSRLIVKVNNPSDPAVASYFKQKDYQINEDRLQASKAGGIVKVIMSVVGVVGIFFISLSFVIFMMNFRLIIAEAKEEIRLLIQLGYTTKMIAGFLVSYFLIYISVIVSITFIALYFALQYVSAFFIEKNLEISAQMEPMVIFTALLFIGLTIALNLFSIFRLLNKYA